MAISIKKMTVLVACAALLGSANLANAADRHDQRRPVATQSQHRPGAAQRPRPSVAPRRPGRPVTAHGPRRPVAQAHRNVRPAYRRGGHIPNTWQRGYSRHITNWHTQRNLYQPPRGYQWVRGNNGDALLVAIATGVIASIVANAVIR